MYPYRRQAYVEAIAPSDAFPASRPAIMRFLPSITSDACRTSQVQRVRHTRLKRSLLHDALSQSVNFNYEYSRIHWCREETNRHPEEGTIVEEKCKQIN